MFGAVERKSGREKNGELSLIPNVQLCKKDTRIFSPCRCLSVEGFITWRKYNDKKIYLMG
jgi:hypothetical protein